MICWFENSNNNVSSNTQHLYLLSSISSRHFGFYVQNFNSRKSIALFVARNRDIILSDFKNNDDVYLAPNNMDKHK